MMIESLGVSAFRVRIVVFVIAALLAALSGWLYAHMSRFVSPAPFDVKAGIDYLFMVMAGGAGQIAGAVIGAAAVTLLKNWLQDVLPLVTQDTGRFEIIIFAILFILILQHARTGIVPFVLRRLPRPAAKPIADAPPLPRRAYPERGTPLLAAERMVKRFGGLVAVNEVSFALNAREILALIGPNGAGKSTMFNLITGATRPDGGRVTLLRQRYHGRGAETDRPGRHRPDVPARQAAARHDGARQRDARRLSAHPGRVPRRRTRGSTAPRRLARATRRCAQLRRVGLRRHGA